MALFLVIVTIVTWLHIPNANAFVSRCSIVPRRRCAVGLQNTEESNEHYFQNTNNNNNGPWISSLSRALDYKDAVEECLLPSISSSSERKANICFVFMSLYHAPKFAEILHTLQTELEGIQTVAMVGGGVIGNNKEINEETVPAISLLMGFLEHEKDMDINWYNELQQPPPPKESPEWNSDQLQGALIFGDPWSPINTILANLPKTSVAGGISVPNGVKPTVGLNGQPLPQGSAIVISLRRSLGLQVISSHGCRPMGPVCTITACEGNVITHLDDQPALDVLEGLQISTEERRQLSSGPAGSGILCGLAEASNNPEYLIRQLIGFAPHQRALVVGGELSEGQLFRFHVRDKEAALNDFELTQKRYQSELLFEERSCIPLAALQFSCVARGRSFFQKSNADVENTRDLLEISGVVNGTPAVAGAFCNGELGPLTLAGVGSVPNGQTFLHAFTMVAALICQVSSVSLQEKEAQLLSMDDNAWG